MAQHVRRASGGSPEKSQLVSTGSSALPILRKTEELLISSFGVTLGVMVQLPNFSQFPGFLREGERFQKPCCTIWGRDPNCASRVNMVDE